MFELGELAGAVAVGDHAEPKVRRELVQRGGDPPVEADRAQLAAGEALHEGDEFALAQPDAACVQGAVPDVGADRAHRAEVGEERS
ncbi:hypothetical protein ADL27_56605 [Streptomyces sp. NRRL F-6602]|nr:hypothetical protein ADL27_56605 [Streptomyces sp. NRRL F-6602]